MDNETITARVPHSTDAVLGSLDSDMLILLPAVYAIIAMVMSTGLLGNLLVVVVYVTKFKATTTRSFIIALAVIDLVNCAVGMPLDLLNVSRNLGNPTAVLCKTVAAILSFSYFCSAFVLFLVAADRYWKICRPFSSQLTVRKANLAVVGCAAVTPAVAWPFVLIWGLRLEKMGQPNATSPVCDTENHFDSTPYPLIYYYLLLFIAMGGIVYLMALYSQIILQIGRQQRNHKCVRPSLPDAETSHAVSASNRVTTEQSCTATEASHSDQRQIGQSRVPVILGDLNLSASPRSDIDGRNVDQAGDIPLDLLRSDFGNNRETENSDNSPPSRPDSSSDVTESASKGAQESMSDGTRPAAEESAVFYTRTDPADCVYSIKRNRTDKHEAIIRRTTCTMLVVTLVYVVSFLPFLVTRLLRAHDVIHINSWPTLLVVAFADRSVFIQSVANPLIYGIRHPEFRDKCRRLLRCSK